MRRPLAVLLLCPLALARVEPALGRQLQTSTLQANARGSPAELSGVCDVSPWQTGRAGCSVLVDVPAGCATAVSTSCPLVFFFHGAGGTNTAWSSQLGSFIHESGYAFIGVYPLGFEYGGANYWNTGSQDGTTSDCSAAGSCSSDPDDLAFVQAIVARLQALGAAGRRYAYGNSNGAALTNRIGVNGGMNFSGIVTSATQLTASPSTSGPLPYHYNYPSQGTGTRAIAVLAMHGSADNTIPIGGGPLFGGPFVLATALDSIGVWADAAGCAGTASVSSFPGSYFASGQVTTSVTQWEYACPDHTPVTYMQIACAGHNGPSTINGTSKWNTVFGFIAGVDAACDASTTVPQSSQQARGPSDACESQAVHGTEAGKPPRRATANSGPTSARPTPSSAPNVAPIAKRQPRPRRASESGVGLCVASASRPGARMNKKTSMATVDAA